MSGLALCSQSAFSSKKRFFVPNIPWDIRSFRISGIWPDIRYLAGYPVSGRISSRLNGFWPDCLDHTNKVDSIRKTTEKHLKLFGDKYCYPYFKKDVKSYHFAPKEIQKTLQLRQTGLNTTLEFTELVKLPIFELFFTFPKNLFTHTYSYDTTLKTIFQKNF